MYGAGAAVAEIAELPWIVSPLNGHQAHGLGHQSVGHGTHSARRLLNADAERFSQMEADDRPGRVEVKSEGALQESIRVEITQDEVAVRHCRARSAPAIASRARIGTRTLRPNPHTTSRVNPGN